MKLLITLIWLGLVPLLFAEELFPKELTQWQPISDKPLFTPSTTGWDRQIRERGWILPQAPMQWKLWYTGYDGTKTGIRRLGYATSTDGLSWQRQEKPLVADQWIEDMVVVQHQQRYLLFAEGEQDRAHWFTSPDGIQWTREGALRIRQTNGKQIPDGPYGTPFVFKQDQEWFLFYERKDAGVWLARSKDLQEWVHVQDEPVLKPGPDGFDSYMIALNQVVAYENGFYAFYHGRAGSATEQRNWGVGIAYSKDLIHWTKYDHNPILPLEWNRSSGFVVPLKSGWRLYTTHPVVYAYQSK